MTDDLSGPISSILLFLLLLLFLLFLPSLLVSSVSSVFLVSYVSSPFVGAYLRRFFVLIRLIAPSCIFLFALFLPRAESLFCQNCYLSPLLDNVDIVHSGVRSAENWHGTTVWCVMVSSGLGMYGKAG